MDTQKRTKKEQRRLINCLKKAGVDPKKLDLMMPIVEQAAWMKVKLEDTIEVIGDQGVAIEYDNGGGQSGIRENPNFKGFYSLHKRYESSIEKLSAVIPVAVEQKEFETHTEVKNMLELVRERRQA